MKKKFNPFLFFLLIFAIESATAQKETIDEKAKGILNELSKKTRAYNSIKAEFDYSIENIKEKISETKKGSLTLKKEKYKFSIAGQEIVSDGKTLWTYIKDAGEVQIDNAPDSNKVDNSLSPTNIFTVYEKGFKYKWEKEEVREGKTMHIINLYPIKANEKPYHTIKLFIDKNAMEINTVLVLNKDGGKYTYHLTKFETNLPLKDGDFIFDTSRAKEIIDLR